MKQKDKARHYVHKSDGDTISNEDFDRLLEQIKNDPRILQGAQKSLNLRLFPLELERFRRLCEREKKTQREMIVAMMDIYEQQKA